MCDSWRSSYLNFIRDLGQRPPGMTLDRINNDGPYSPENVRWADMRTQSNNRRGNVLLKAFGDTKTMREWSRDPRCAVSYQTLYNRIRVRGWDTVAAITKPAMENRYV